MHSLASDISLWSKNLPKYGRNVLRKPNSTAPTLFCHQYTRLLRAFPLVHPTGYLNGSRQTLRIIKERQVRGILDTMLIKGAGRASASRYRFHVFLKNRQRSNEPTDSGTDRHWIEVRVMGKMVDAAIPDQSIFGQDLYDRGARPRGTY